MNIYKFYNTYGWKEKNNISKDAELFEDLRKNSENYVSNCRKRINNYLSAIVTTFHGVIKSRKQF